jgi:hypothetical protein
MIRFLHFVAISALIASAGYAYSIKYDTLYQQEQVAKLKAQMKQERDAIAVLKAEWQHLNRPDRLQAAVERHLDLQPMNIRQLARLSELPDRPKRQDEIGLKLQDLLGATATPKTEARGAGTQTPKR